MNRSILPSAALLLMTMVADLGAAKPTPFTTQSKPMNAKVTILAVSSSSRQSFAGNQEVYLADLQTKDSDHTFVKLVDQYPGFGLPIRAALLKEQTVFQMKVTREPECDVQGASFFLSTGRSVVFNGSVRDLLQSHSTDTLPCYKSLHGTIKIAKK